MSFIILGAAFLSGCGQPSTGNSAVNQSQGLSQTGRANTATGNSSGSSTTNSLVGGPVNGSGNDTTGNTTGSNATGSGSSSAASNVAGSGSAAAPRFAGYTTDIMNYVEKETTMPLFAPTEPTFTPHATAVSAEVFRSASSYSVDLYATAKPLPINDPSLNTRGTGAEIANFDGQAYASPAAAMQALQATAEAFPVDHSQPSTQVDLGEGVTARLYPYKASNVPSNYSVMEWHEGKWTIDVYGTASLDLINQAKQVVNYLHINFLPMTNGILQVNPPGATGPSTSLSWVFGTDMYFCSTRDSLSAMELAVSMREYPSYRIAP
ncbi:hypothetical protein AN477_14310 [Alicyclobacillus ferrooxydans]|uniref:Uncharacterized protein n=2 Tax=Alicyclobacillus ferrooxydans TaxID=471514 RepID=A0A0N8PP20_9BACL|nr:hypothetical protein AN477_14310 [Alicyclobacillus ferrooxydans]